MCKINGGLLLILFLENATCSAFFAYRLSESISIHKTDQKYKIIKLSNFKDYGSFSLRKNNDHTNGIPIFSSFNLRNIDVYFF